ncbi:MAG: PAS domain S-box protein [Desulfobulbus sp.]|nr:PAS domain S-box protein [Desulfobulbus sp.]
MYLVSSQWSRSIEQDLEAAGAGVVKSMELVLDNAVIRYVNDITKQNVYQAAREAGLAQQDGVAVSTESKQLFVESLETKRIGSTGFLMGFDGKGVVQFHPDRDLPGKEILDVPEYQQFRSFFKEQMLEKPENPVSHRHLMDIWQGQARGLVLLYFKPCDWFIVGIWYPEEIVRFVDLLPLKEWMGNVRYGRSGVAFLLDNNGKAVLHPLLKEEAIEVLAARIVALPAWISAEKNRTVRVQWQEASEQSDTEQLLYLSRLPSYGMTAGIITASRSVFADSRTTCLVAVLSLLTVTFLAAVSTVVLNVRVLSPLGQMLQQVSLSGHDPVGFRGNEVSVLRRILTELERCAKQLKQDKDRLAVETHRRKSAEAFLQIYKRIFDSAGEGMMITDGTGRILAVNESFTAITGYPQAEVISRNPSTLQSGQHGAEFYAQMWQSLNEKGVWEGEIWNRKKDGTIYPQWLTINRLQGDNSEVIHYFASFYEIGELKKREKQIAFMANYDILTRLPNRLYFEQKLTRSLSRAKRDGAKLALLYIDLDNFKNINDDGPVKTSTAISA